MQAATTGPPVNCALLAGGGMRTGQVIGATDKQAAYVVGPAGLVPERLRDALPQPRHRPGHRLSDRGGRPMTLLDDREPIRELI